MFSVLFSAAVATFAQMSTIKRRASAEGSAREFVRMKKPSGIEAELVFQSFRVPDGENINVVACLRPSRIVIENH